MAEVLVSLVLEQLASFTNRQIEQQWSLVRSGVEEKVENLSNNLEDIQMVLVDADKRQIVDASVKRWLDKLKVVSYEIETTMYEWNTAIALRSNLKLFDKVCFFTLPCLHRNHVHRHGLHRRVGLKIEKLNEKLDRISNEKERYTFRTAIEYESYRSNNTITTSFVDVSKVCGRDVEKKILIDKLLNDDENNNGNNIIPLVGMGGIGKTTLAQLVYNDEKVNAYFNLKIWVCVSDPFDEIAIAREICVALEVKKEFHKLDKLQDLLTHIKESIVGKKFLLVLDDVWSEDNRKWEPLEESLRYGDEGSKILVTTRKKHVATMMKVREEHIISIRHLSEEVCLNIFNQLAFSDNEGQGELKEIGVKIAQKCKGLPLVAKALGSLMRFKKYTEENWNEVLRSDLWKLGDRVENEVFVPFLLSYYDLPSLEKRCLLYCSIFPKDYNIDRDELIQLWMSQGYLTSSEEDERKGINCFENLVAHSFFQDFERDEHENIIRCKMHDIVHDFVLFLTKNDCFNSHISSKNDELKLLSSKAFHYTLLLECNVPRSEYYKLNINLCPILHLEYLSCTFSPWSIVPPSIYNKRKLLTLSIIGNPGSIKWDLLFKLTCLRTLNLSGCLPPNSKIPKGIDKLILLRYLNLSNNGWLVLPKTLGNLFNLQTLNLEKSRGWLPKEIGKLVNLRHLYLGDFCCKFSKELGKLTGLKTLESYNFLYVVVEKRGKMLFQNWMMSLNNLKSLVLVRCNYCVSLGPFGNLPSLESLTLNFMINVKTLGNEFLGIENTTTTTESFPKLKTLRFIEFWSWEEWKYCSDRSQAIMPRLQFLHFDRCEKLEAPLPEFLRNTMLKTLTIRQCNKLKPLFKEGLRMEELVNILTR
ncbi:putative disease resistance protein RGA4 [Cannabis sativa]|uniref:putative disease resistance protein RGA4 n=1 Tax=Cannabis sativa TaxID=3483 RepID=UPI0029CA7BE4|nr:putative disease resistance protein RGA4 [Cannabis sativa]